MEWFLLKNNLMIQSYFNFRLIIYSMHESVEPRDDTTEIT